MSVHIGAEPGQVAPTVLLPGDPLRARFVAEEYLDDAVQYNAVRGMLGFTGTYRGVPVSVQGTGMGIPSTAIYATELIRFYGARRLIRIGSCGAYQPELDLHSIILALSASTDSATNRIRFSGKDYAPTVSPGLLLNAVRTAESMGIHVTLGNVLSSDTFYQDDPEAWKLWADYGVLAVEMETSALYTIAANHGVEALSVLTVSDSLVSHKELSAEDRQRSFHEMTRLTLETVVAAEAGGQS